MDLDDVRDNSPSSVVTHSVGVIYRTPEVVGSFSPGGTTKECDSCRMQCSHMYEIWCRKVNVGPVRSYTMMKELAGSHDNVGASKQDFKNFYRDLKAYIAGSDAQIYNMIFGPFTGVDHHKKCVTFAASFVAHEDISSFEWVFKIFLKSMGNNEPVCLITDQDPAMKVAIRNVFQTTEHRFCMWHIMKKVPEKVGRAITQETDFLKKLCACVWHLEIEPEEFEEKWNKVISEFNLNDHEWLAHMFNIRDMWIPAYFRDLFLGGIMRTTSRSESENNFFTMFTNPHLTLIEFYMRFECALDAQRHTQNKMDNDSKNKRPECKTLIPLEKDASELFTTTIFYDFQYEVEIGCFNCGVEEMKNDNEIYIFKLREGSRRRAFDVVFDPTTLDTKCFCKKFERDGVPCRHMIWVWKARMLEKIPKTYVLNRWCTMAYKKPIFYLEGNVLEECLNAVDKKMLLNDLWCEIHACVSLVQNNEDDLSDLVKKLRAMRIDLEQKKTTNGSNNFCSKVKDIEMLIGASLPSEVLIKAPKISKNKGTGVHVPNQVNVPNDTPIPNDTHVPNSNKRMKSDREKAVEQSQKKKRLCRACGELGHHDSRNCPGKVK
ncbi:protein FAR1-RELATED SEQUENCE 5-like [Chenopodium quinoa]|uniref:protein FAR1-RELATED SEQUENCE 5-like n=1 Tax=Chenopodium quinoa TaxID=63459 RepID=UPI000B775892|nr:protein FAR1-RELATED SEQUENCE 5-like [Chenopodium quinoa]